MMMILAYILISSLSLPLPLIEIVSPARAKSLIAARDIAGVIEQQTALSYVAPQATFYAIYGLALLLYFHIAITTLRSQEFLPKLLWVITIIGSFEAFYGLLQAMNPDIGVLWLPTNADQYRGCARGTIIYRNQYALFLNLCWPAAAAFGISLYAPIYTKYSAQLKRGRNISLSQRVSLFADKAAVPLFCSALMMLAILFSQSRGGIIIMLLIGLLFGCLLPTTRKQKIITSILLLLFFSVYGSLMGGFHEIAIRFSQFLSGAEVRITIWLASLSMLKSHMLTGIGMGGYEFLSLLYLEGVAEKIWYSRAHNEYLELAIELGLPVAITLYIWFIAGTLGYFRLVIGIKHEKDKIQHMSLFELFAVAAFCSLIAFLMHGFVDFVWRLPTNIIYLITLVALLSSAKHGPSKKKLL